MTTMEPITEKLMPTKENIKFVTGAVRDLISGGITASVRFDDEGLMSLHRDRRGMKEVLSEDHHQAV